MYTREQRPRRSAFTLIELLVVIAIIAILSGLLLAGVMTFMSKPAEVKTRNDISQLSLALDNFHGKFKVYPPSKIKLCAYYSEYTAADTESLTYLNRIWPNISKVWADTTRATPLAIDWAGTYPTYLPKGGVVLEGDQCLVFFLSGIPLQTQPGAHGFSTDTTDPSNLSTLNPNTPTNVVTTARPNGSVAANNKISFFEFNTNQLKKRGTNTFLPTTSPLNAAPYNRAGEFFYSYVDPYETAPYVYFSSGLRTGGNAYQASHAIYMAGLTDAAGVAPMAEAANKYVNPTRFQILSAGKDHTFGPGGLWSGAAYTAGAGPGGKDDLGNFNDGKILGVR